ncbi:hypothetical protein BO70DRAFT_367066 [Aspergillus heteromorphus CBS 117.55]|uniref:Uncharacterized protein n=1 Tax=Aspergillus heteromorphus CBS 117.55 TaxID=1448321 RepID=A0A317UR24_9EURO|nr:uncharacterized protein BO70DRAFT_367066 [Aspergillus heteromorphus CBS 117.55]PWY64065.1 hypothetical protein BO70DRAFT_367066 [Aspergillus heteromorphus CBS 117.55]
MPFAEEAGVRGGNYDGRCTTVIGSCSWPLRPLSPRRCTTCLKIEDGFNFDIKHQTPGLGSLEFRGVWSLSESHPTSHLPSRPRIYLPTAA